MLFGRAKAQTSTVEDFNKKTKKHTILETDAGRRDTGNGMEEISRHKNGQSSEEQRKTLELKT